MLRTIILTLLSTTGAFSANILFISPLPSPSHHIWNRALAYGLVSKGHNVTLIGPDKDKTYPENYTHIFVEGLYEDMDSHDMIDASTLTAGEILISIEEFAAEMCETFLKSSGTKILLNYPDNFFDLILLDITGAICPLGLVHKFGYPPTIGVTAFLLPPNVASTYGNHLIPSYIPWNMHSLLTSDLTFVERFWNFIFTYGELLIRRIGQYPAELKIARKFLGDEVPPLQEIERHVSLVLTNTDPILDKPQPMAPNFIPVGGLHIKKAQKLPQDLQTVLDGAKNGAIIFSLGSNVRSDKLNKEIQKSLLDAFEKLKQTVIWKFESEVENLPKNVIVRKWLPQNDLLGHPNVRLFIGHGGALSTQEAIYHGVPIICIPFIVDQHLNTESVVNKKLGLSVDLAKITETYISEKLHEVLDNPIYFDNVQKMSRRFRDRPETPLERALFWIEYVLRHYGAQFLSTSERDLPIYVSTSLDVVAVILLISFLVLYFAIKFIKFVWRLSHKKEKLKIN